MKHLKLFNNQQEFNSYKNGDNYILPNVSLINDNKTMSYQKRYTNLKYVASTQSGGQYISLGNELQQLLKPNDIVRIELKYFFQGNGKDSNNQCTIMSVGGQTYGYFLRRYNSAAQCNGTSNFNNNVGTSPINLTQNYRIIQEITMGFTMKSTYNPNATMEINDSMCKFRISPTTFFVSYTRNNDYDTDNIIMRYGEAKIYWCKIKVNDELIYDLIPMKDNQTNQIGLYCNMHKQLYAGHGDSPLIYEE